MSISTISRLAMTVAVSAVLAATSFASEAQQPSERPYQLLADAQKENQNKQEKQNEKDNKKDEKDNQKAHKQQRLTQQQQQELIRQQQQSLAQYNQQIAQQQAIAQRNAQQLQQQKRMAHYRFQQAYYERLRQQARLLNDRYDYDNDPYYYTPPNYRYRRGSSYYQTNQYGADILRQALNYGYQEGYQAGRADKQDNWRFDYRQSFAYQDANYGYVGRYVRQDDYNYYFREGFQRGYDDGYRDRRAYGRNTNGSDTLLGSVLDAILNLQSLQ